MSLGEPLIKALTMFPSTALNIARNADIERSVWSVRDDVYPAASHILSLSVSSVYNKKQNVDRPDKPGDDVGGKDSFNSSVMVALVFLLSGRTRAHQSSCPRMRGIHVFYILSKITEKQMKNVDARNKSEHDEQK